jgi:hypothetical protein
MFRVFGRQPAHAKIIVLARGVRRQAEAVAVDVAVIAIAALRVGRDA